MLPPNGPAYLDCAFIYDLVRYADITHDQFEDLWACNYQNDRRIACHNQNHTRVVAYRIRPPQNCGATHVGIGRTNISATANVSCDEARRVAVDNHNGGWPCGGSDECWTYTDGYSCHGIGSSDGSSTDYYCVRRDHEVDYNEGP